MYRVRFFILGLSIGFLDLQKRYRKTVLAPKLSVPTGGYRESK
jgi:hypothetical protein